MGPNESKNLWISLGAGIFATFMLYSYSQEKKAEVDKQLGAKMRVVVAKEDIRDLENIYDNVLEVVEKYKSDVEPDAFTEIPDVVGTVAAIPIKKGQTLTKNKVLEPGPDTGMAIQVSPNRRAVTIPVDPTRANGGLIRPGDRVDIFAVVDIGKGAAQKREVVLLMQDIIILATGVNLNNTIPRTIEKDPSGRGLIQTTLTGDTKYTNITIEVAAADAQDLVYLVSTNPSSLYFLLRNPNDRRKVAGLQASTAESIQQKAINQSFGQSSGFSSPTQPNLNGGAIARPPGN
jgi:pilus assembly protein CpaB